MWHLLPTHCFVGNILSLVFTDTRLACVLTDFLLYVPHLPLAFR